MLLQIYEKTNNNEKCWSNIPYSIVAPLMRQFQPVSNTESFNGIFRDALTLAHFKHKYITATVGVTELLQYQEIQSGF